MRLLKKLRIYALLFVLSNALSIILVLLLWVKPKLVKALFSLKTQLNTQKQKTLQQAKDEFGKYCDSAATNINTYFEELIAGLEAIAAQLETARIRLEGAANYLNRAYAKRIIDWSIQQYEPLNDDDINSTIAKVERSITKDERKFERSIIIKTKLEIQLKKSQAELQQVLQENISIQSINY